MRFAVSQLRRFAVCVDMLNVLVTSFTIIANAVAKSVVFLY